MFSNRGRIILAVFLAALLGGTSAQGQEEGLFTSLAPDALVVLDLSGSMNWTPAGSTMYTATNCDSTTAAFYTASGTGHTLACSISSTGSVPKYAANTSCIEPFYRTTATSHPADCSRMAIAKRAIFNILDDTGDGTVNTQDEQSLNVRIGYMRFYNCGADDTGGSYSSGCNSLVWGINSRYSRIYCNSSTSCTSASSAGTSVSGESATGGTPLASSLAEAKLYLDAHKAADTAGACRQKFVILVTDGSDTYACGGSGAEDQTDQYKRRRATVDKAKALSDAGYQVFVVGFGPTMPHWVQNTLNWAAYVGGTDNPLTGNSGNTSAYIPQASCAVTATTHHNIDSDGDHYYATSNDPGELPLSGYAFLATSAAELNDALKQAVSMIREATYSFSLASVSSQRTIDENNIYEASFTPINRDPFWDGHLKKLALNADGTVGSAVWDAGTVMASQAAGTRTIKTYKGGVLVDFTTGTITRGDLGVNTDAERDAIVGFFRGEAAYNPDDWKLGDVFHSNPIVIGTPASYFTDNRDAYNAFDAFRSSTPRTSVNGKRLVLIGANDGQIHALLTGSGQEAWSFIPPNFLPKLKNIAHTANPTGLTHQYFVDGPVAAADVWLGPTGDGRSKNAADWKTILMVGEGRGGATNPWSSSSSCDSGFNAAYNSTYPYYCGYYAFDLTNSTVPVYKWRVNPNAGQAPYLGDPWSKPEFGRVKIAGNETWVAFIGGGYNATDCTGVGTCDSRGKGFYVIDLKTGDILWSYTHGDNGTMDYSVPGIAAIVDTDNDGFVDTAYIGDLGGNIWRFKFCTDADTSSCGTGNWSGGMLFNGSSGRPIFTQPSVAKDNKGQIWVEWGTGDKTDPTATTFQEKFFAAKDTDRSTTLSITNLDNITGGTYTDSPTKKGWYINLGVGGEKILADPAIFGGLVYFSTYTPPGGNNPCNQAGTANLYGVNFATGAGGIAVYADGQPVGVPTRSMSVGTGIPTAPVISFKPIGAGGGGAGSSPTDLYLTVSGGAGMDVSTQRVNFNPPTLSNRTNILFWKDRRLE
jgi:Tfp pilus tip-associated adhesin PilY1